MLLFRLFRSSLLRRLATRLLRSRHTRRILFAAAFRIARHRRLRRLIGKRVPGFAGREG